MIGVWIFLGAIFALGVIVGSTLTLAKANRDLSKIRERQNELSAMVDRLTAATD